MTVSSVWAATRPRDTGAIASFRVDLCRTSPVGLFRGASHYQLATNRCRHLARLDGRHGLPERTPQRRPSWAIAVSSSNGCSLRRRPHVGRDRRALGVEPGRRPRAVQPGQHPRRSLETRPRAQRWSPGPVTTLTSTSQRIGSPVTKNLPIIKPGDAPDGQGVGQGRTFLLAVPDSVRVSVTVPSHPLDERQPRRQGSSTAGRSHGTAPMRPAEAGRGTHTVRAEPPKVYTVEEVAELLKVSEGTVRHGRCARLPHSRRVRGHVEYEATIHHRKAAQAA